MSKLVSVILVLVLFLGSAMNIFASDDRDRGGSGSGGGDMEGTGMTVVYVVAGIILVGFAVWGVVEWFKSIFSVEAETPDNGIRMVSTEDEVPSVSTDGKTVLDVLKHVEAGVTPNNDIYVGFRFQY